MNTHRISTFILVGLLGFAAAGAVAHAQGTPPPTETTAQAGPSDQGAPPTTPSHATAAQPTVTVVAQKDYENGEIKRRLDAIKEAKEAPSDEVFALWRDLRRILLARLDELHAKLPELQDDVALEREKQGDALHDRDRSKRAQEWINRHGARLRSEILEIKNELNAGGLSSEQKTKKEEVRTDKEDALQSAEEDASSLSKREEILRNVSLELSKSEAKLESAQSEKEFYQRTLADVDSKISSLLRIETEKDDYKQKTSERFALLIGVVIVGFFVVTLVTKTAGDIFKNQSGLQFITLFSLVISIVLFGILGILGGKELAALLGAISGYVLGRVSAGEVQSALSVPGVSGGQQVATAK